MSVCITVKSHKALSDETGLVQRYPATYQLILVGCDADENRLRKHESPEFLGVEILDRADILLPDDVHPGLVLVH